MRWKQVLVLFALPFAALQVQGATEITQYGITWTFDQDYQTGQFCNGDYWVVGPVKITSIANSWHKNPGLGLDGSMINPPATDKQGYDKRLTSYVASLNVVENGSSLQLRPGESLISSVSWLAGESGCPNINKGTGEPRPVLRDAAVLTCLESAPPEGSFRPPYCGKDKTIRFNKKDLKYDLLPSLSSVSGAPDISKIEKTVERPWIDHAYQYLGAMVHPTENMPQYGREFSIAIGDAALTLLLDFPAAKKEKLLIGFVQIGIDFAAIADNDGGWPSNGGHNMGRKWPILFAGIMLNDEHMKNVGQWKTVFQEDHDTFYVSQTEVDMTHSSAWKPDYRATKKPYEVENIGLPEWGIVHTAKLSADNMDWGTTYRQINNQSYTGWVLAALIMGQKQVWNHDPLFDYVDRATAIGMVPGTKGGYAYMVFGGDFVMNMWKTYREKYGPMWVPDNSSDFYSPGKLKSR